MARKGRKSKNIHSQVNGMKIGDRVSHQGYLIEKRSRGYVVTNPAGAKNTYQKGTTVIRVINEELVVKPLGSSMKTSGNVRFKVKPGKRRNPALTAGSLLLSTLGILALLVATLLKESALRRLGLNIPELNEVVDVISNPKVSMWILVGGVVLSVLGLLISKRRTSVTFAIMHFLAFAGFAVLIYFTRVDAIVGGDDIWGIIKNHPAFVPVIVTLVLGIGFSVKAGMNRRG